MDAKVKTTEKTTVITSAELLEHWQGHRSLTRRIIEAFPEKELYAYSLGGMRPFGDMVQELLAIAVPGTRQMAGEPAEALDEYQEQAKTKAGMLALWDEATLELNRYWALIPEERFRERILAFGQYEGTVWSTVLYFIDNEIHHRGQGYVYLRSLGVEPPQFWDR